jgi:hypothetical protein
MRDYPEEVKAAFLAQHGDGNNLSNVQRMNFQHDAAKTLLSSKYAHLEHELEEKAKDEHNVGMNEWNVVLGDISLAENVVQCVCPSLFLRLD